MHRSTPRDEFVRYAAPRMVASRSSEEGACARETGAAYSSVVEALQLWRVVSALQRHCSNFQCILNVGPYRRALNELLHHSFLRNFVYWAIGPDVSRSSALMDAYERRFAAELDPGVAKPSSLQEWPVKHADCALLLDVIDYLADPMPCLDAINRALRPGGILVLMTNNLTSLPRAYRMLRWGQSPNTHPSRSSPPVQGKWGSPLREFSAGELVFFLRLSGFKLTEQIYFERGSDEYRQGNDGVIARAPWPNGLKELPRHMILRFAPYLADRQLLVATKAEPYEDVVRRRPRATSSMSEWLRMCAEFGV